MALPERVANLGGAQQQQLQNRTPSTSASSSMSLGLQNKPKMTFRTEDAAYRALEKAAVYFSNLKKGCSNYLHLFLFNFMYANFLLFFFVSPTFIPLFHFRHHHHILPSSSSF
jgi:hypothetical protein